MKFIKTIKRIKTWVPKVDTDNSLILSIHDGRPLSVSRKRSKTKILTRKINREYVPNELKGMANFENVNRGNSRQFTSRFVPLEFASITNKVLKAKKN